MANVSARNVAFIGNGEAFKKKFIEENGMVDTSQRIEEKEDDDIPQETDAPTITSQLSKNVEYKWKNIIIIAYCHIGAVYAIYLVLTTSKFATLLWALLYGVLTLQGTTAGAHRLWSHKAYKATWQLRLMLMLMHTATLTGTVYEWVRDHRVHHKYTDTSADPHNSTRGFFYSHIGWILIKKNADVIRRGKEVDMSDINNDSILMFQKKHYYKIAALVWGLIPTAVPWYFWNESWWSSFYIVTVLRYVVFLHITLSVNSWAHMIGYRPYDKSMSAVQNKLLAYLTMGEGWHNYHHVFPWDYKTAELPLFSANWTVAFIHLMAHIGWAYDLKAVPLDIVAKRAIRTGDGSHHAAAKEEDEGNCQILYSK